MFKYMRLLGCKISSFFNYIFEKFTLKKKKYKNDDDDDDIISYDDIYNENVIHINLLEA